MSALPSAVAVLRNARLPDGRVVDVEIDSGTVTAVGPASGGAGPASVTNGESIDLDGFYLLTAGAEPHAHVDKAYSWSKVVQSYGDLTTAIESWHTHARVMTTDDVYERARRAFADYLASGVTAVRTHVDLLLGSQPLRGLQAVLRLRDELRGIMDIQVALLCSSLNPLEHITAALELGVDVMGGCPHLAEDPVDETRRLLDLAARYGLPVDLHTDEQLDTHMTSIRVLAAEVARRGLGGRAAASHSVSLGMLEPDELAVIVDELREAGVAVVSLPITNLYLQGRDRPVATPRGLTALRALLDAGVTVAAGGDNVRDPFNPMGRADMFETTSLLVTAGHLDAGQALHAVTGGARQVLGLPRAGVESGARADLVAVRADTLADVLAGAGADRIVLHGGRVVSRTTVRTESALDRHRSTVAPVSVRTLEPTAGSRR